MDWMKLLTPIISLGLSIVTGLALNALRGYIKTKTGIAISDDQFDAAKKAVLAVEEKCLAKTVICPGGAAKKGLATELLVEARPDTKGVAGVLIDQAVAILPGVGETGKQGGKYCPVTINPNNPAG